jgi:hypothetical protein
LRPISPRAYSQEHGQGDIQALSGRFKHLFLLKSRGSCIILQIPLSQAWNQQSTTASTVCQPGQVLGSSTLTRHDVRTHSKNTYVVFRSLHADWNSSFASFPTSQLIAMPPPLEDVRIKSIPSSAYYIADFITQEEERVLLKKVSTVLCDKAFAVLT